jgi:surfeit locus 1 family protein
LEIGGGMILRALFSRRWRWTTLLVIAAIGVMARLGVWQLDRLAQRRAFNARVAEQQAQPPLTLDGAALDADLTGMEYRSVIVSGEYDHAQEVALRNQVNENQLGVHLLTPLVISGSGRAVLVDRGWVPAEQSAPEDRRQFAEPGTVTVRGLIRLSRSQPDFGGVPDPTPAPGSAPLLSWNMVNVDRIGQQTTHPLLPIYIQEAPDPSWTGAPIRSQPELDLTEGSHMGYALQWFAFAAILGAGYLRFLASEIRR